MYWVSISGSGKCHFMLVSVNIHLNASKYERMHKKYISWCMWVAASIHWCMWTAASHVHLLVYVNGCFTCTSVGVYELLLRTHICWCIWTMLYTYICWCMWTAASHVRLLVYMNSCFTHKSVGVYEWLVHTHTHICWCTWMAALHVHLLVHLGTITVSPHNLCHHKLYGVQNITIHLVLSQTLYGPCSITTY
jgi:hypothetical protein